MTELTLPYLGDERAAWQYPFADLVRAGFLPDQRPSMEQAFAAYTSGSAFVNHLDDTGTLAPGMLADLVILDRDPFAGDPAVIGATSVVATYVDGVAVYPNPRAG